MKGSKCLKADEGIEAPGVRDRIQVLLDEAATLPGVLAVTGPSDGRPGFVSPAGAVARAEVRFKDDSDRVPVSSIDALMEAVKHANGDGLTVEIGGEVVRTREQPQIGSEYIGRGIAAIVLLLAFGSVIAAGLPLIAAIGGFGIGVATVTVATRVWDFPEFSPQFMGMNRHRRWDRLQPARRNAVQGRSLRRPDAGGRPCTRPRHVGASIRIYFCSIELLGNSFYILDVEINEPKE